MIEYTYSFSENVFPAGVGLLRFYLWIIPFSLIYSYLKHRKSLLKLFLVVMSVSILFNWEYSSLNNKFGSITYDRDSVTIEQKNGNSLIIPAKDINRFWSVTIGRNGGWTCHLFIDGMSNSYQSFNVNKREHSCLDDANILNEYFNKN
jgi:hypothetical protein